MTKGLVILALVCAISAISVKAAEVQYSQEQVRDLIDFLRANAEKEEQNFCQGCRSMVSFATQFNSSQPLQSEHKKLFRDFCALYYPASTDFQQGPCNIFVEGLYALFNRIDPVHHCDQIGACGEPTPMAASDTDLLPTRAGNVVCDMCQSAIKQFQDQLKDPKFIDTLHEQIDSFCEYMKVIGQDDECKQMVNKYVDQAIDFVKQIDSLKYCQTIQLCSVTQTDSLTNEAAAPISPSLVQFKGFGLETSVALDGKVVKELSSSNSNNELEKARLARSGPVCTLCKTVIKEVVHYLKDNQTEEAIESALSKVCQLLFRDGSPSQEQCDDMVKAYTKELLKLLADESDPELICTLIEQCTYRDVLAQEALQAEALAHKPATLEEVFKSKKEIPQVNIPSIGDLITMLDPQIQLNSMRTCVECKLFINYLQETFDTPKSRDTLKQWLLDNLCLNLSDSTQRDSCRRMVDKYGDDFFKAIAGELDPQVVCADLKACKRRSMFGLLNLLEPEFVDNSEPEVETDSGLESEPSGDEAATEICDECVEVITKLDEYVSSHSIDDDETVLIEKVCDKIPDETTRDTCAEVVKIVGKQLVEKLHTMDSPRQFCRDVVYLC